ncbi:Uma2 family endonuclease [Streptomyces sp. NPDC014889]|uniref:Uma2 family endonuclease n=1 Tax=Streptomyces sp. NPDC014889 TaxID=3364928 RepID=UPI0037004B85
MTVMAQHMPSQMSVEEFEELAAHVAERFVAVRLEFVDGRVGIKGMTNGSHGEIAMWLVFQCKHARPDLTLNTTGQGLKVEAYRNGRARPDAVLAPVGHFNGQGEWAAPDGVLMVVEITSYDSDTHRRDRVEKPQAYGEAGIPVYLLIDRDRLKIVVHSDPDPRIGYHNVRVVELGERATLPEPLGFELDTEDLKGYVD